MSSPDTPTPTPDPGSSPTPATAPGDAPRPTPANAPNNIIQRQQELRQKLRLITTAWVFGSIWLWTTAGAAMTRFARELGTPDYGFGILAALPFIGGLFQLPASYLLERFGRRKWMFVVFMTASRLTWALMAAVPWLLPRARTWWWPAMTVMILLAWATNNLAQPPWMNWMADVIPRRIRGRYFSFRSRVTQPVGLLATVAIGYVLDLAEQARAAEPGIMLRVTSAVLAIGCLLGVLDIQLFRRLDDPPTHHHSHDVAWLAKLRQPLADANFRRYLGFNFTLMLALGFIGQYIWLFVFDVAGWSNWMANLLLIGVPLIIQMYSYGVWGRLIDRLGKKPVLIIAGTLLVIGPLGWLLVGRDHLWLGYLITTVSAMVFPGVEIANFNILLDLSAPHPRKFSRPRKLTDPRELPGPARNAETDTDKPQGLHGAHHGTAGGSAYVAVNSVAVALGGILSGLLAAVVSHWLRNLATPFAGVTLTYHGVLFIISAGLRLVAVAWAISLIEPHATGTRDAIRYMTAGLYNNVRSAVLMPTRIVGRVSRWTYRVDIPRR